MHAHAKSWPRPQEPEHSRGLAQRRPQFSDVPPSRGFEPRGKPVSGRLCHHDRPTRCDPVDANEKAQPRTAVVGQPKMMMAASTRSAIRLRDRQPSTVAGSTRKRTTQATFSACPPVVPA